MTQYGAITTSTAAVPFISRMEKAQQPWGPLGVGGRWVQGLLLLLAYQRLLGKLNTAPSRIPALGQRCVMVLRLV